MRKTLAILTMLLGAASLPGASRGPQWLRNAVIYQVYPSSYKDSDGNGIGDIPASSRNSITSGAWA